MNSLLKIVLITITAASSAIVLSGSELASSGRGVLHLHGASSSPTRDSRNLPQDDYGEFIPSPNQPPILTQGSGTR